MLSYVATCENRSQSRSPRTREGSRIRLSEVHTKIDVAVHLVLQFGGSPIETDGANLYRFVNTRKREGTPCWTSCGACWAGLSRSR
jgi:hypothetical protein